MDGRTNLTVYPGMIYMAENAFINVKNASVDIEAVVSVEEGKNNGVLLAQGGRFGGWAFWVKNGAPMYSYNFLGLKLFQVAGKEAMKPGKHTVKVAFEYEGGQKRGAGGTAKLFIDSKQVGQGTIGSTQANVFSLDDTADTAVDTGTPVDEEYGEGQKNAFTGKIEKVTIQVK